METLTETIARTILAELRDNGVTDDTLEALRLASRLLHELESRAGLTAGTARSLQDLAGRTRW